MNVIVPAVANQSTFPLVDLLFDGHLANRLTDWRAQGLSYEAIADCIREEKGHTISASTVRRWCDELEAPEVRAS